MHTSRDDYRQFHAGRHRAILALVEGWLRAPVKNALDIGGGGDIGGLGEAILGPYARTMHAVDQGADVAAGRQRGVEAVALDVDRESLPYPDAHFGLILFASVIEHLYNPRHVLDEIARVAAPGALLVLEAPNAVAFGRRVDALLGRNPFRWFNRYNALEGKAPMELCSVFYTADEAEDLIATAFEVVERRYAMHNPPVNAVKKLVRGTAARLSPALSDSFLLAARRREA